MSKLRPELVDSTRPLYVPPRDTALLLIHNAVKDRDAGLIHGHLHQKGESCAIGCYFDAHRDYSLPSALIDEVAAINDSVPRYTMKQRRAYVLRWLRWKLGQAGVPGFRKPTAAGAPKP